MQVQIKSVANGFVVTVPNVSENNAPAMGSIDYVFSNWDEVTTFLTARGFIPSVSDGV